jgi:hypothetical protein
MLRTDVINGVISKFNYSSYLEIGLNNAADNFDKILCSDKASVDPNPDADAHFVETSDDFFNKISKRRLDIIFLDGLHSDEQLKRDFFNAIRFLKDDGCVIMHDTNPMSEDLTHFPRDKSGTWNGSAYKFVASLNCQKYTIPDDHGCTIVFKKDVITIPTVSDYNTWQYFDQNRKELLNLISWDEFIRL